MLFVELQASVKSAQQQRLATISAGSVKTDSQPLLPLNNLLVSLALNNFALYSLIMLSCFAKDLGFITAQLAWAHYIGHTMSAVHRCCTHNPADLTACIQAVATADDVFVVAIEFLTSIFHTPSAVFDGSLLFKDANDGEATDEDIVKRSPLKFMRPNIRPNYGLAYNSALESNSVSGVEEQRVMLCIQQLHLFRFV